MYRVGIDIGGTSIKCGLFKDERELVRKIEVPTDQTRGWDSLIESVRDAVNRILHDELVPLVNVRGIGIGVPGVVTQHGIIDKAANLPIGEVNLKGRLLSYFPHTWIDVANDANTAALGEMTVLGPAYRNIVLLTIGTGIGAGVIMDGKIVTGRTGSAGEIGHMIVNPMETRKCGCGRRGCLEQYASATGISRLARERLDRELTAKDLFDLAFEEDQGARAIINEITELLGLALANLAVTVDPDCIIIGGGVSQAGEPWLQMIRDVYQENALFSLKDTEIRLAMLGNDAGIYGAQEMVK